MLSLFLFLGLVANQTAPVCSNPGLHSFATNSSVDLSGVPDTRPGTWGTTEAATFRLTFSPPVGCQVRIVRVYGDFLAWPKGPVEPGRTAGVLWGLQTTAPEGSRWVDLGADNTMVYIQSATNGSPARNPFDFTIPGAVLGSDNVLVSKVAVFLNDTGRAIHCEPSFVVVFEFI